MYTEEKESVVKKIARFLKYNKLFFILALIITGLLLYSLFAGKGFFTNLKYQSEKKKLEKQLEEEKNKQDELKKEVEELNTSDQKIEKIAREKYGMTKEGETIYKIEIDSVNER